MNVAALPTKLGPVNLNGANLGRRLRHMTQVERAFLAYDIASGAVIVNRLGQERAAKLCDAARGYVETIAHLTPEERARARFSPGALARFHHRRHELTDAAVGRLLAHIGLDRALAAIDRATAPAPIAAE
jgi:hypothetical protein